MHSIQRQRLRITYTRDATLKYIGHLDMARVWQRIVRRADLPLAYSEGFNPQPKITFAAALPVGCTSAQEVMDIVLEAELDREEVAARLKRTLPPGITLVSIEDVPLHAPALQAQLIASEYEITLDPIDAIDELANRVQRFLDAGEVVRERRGKTYNLRPLVQTLSFERESDRVVIRSRLQATESGTGRPDELASALGIDPNTVKIRRTRLIFQ